MCSRGPFEKTTQKKFRLTRPGNRDGMRRPVYDRSLVEASTNSMHSKCKQRRPALKKTITRSSGRLKEKRSSAYKNPIARLTVGIDLGDQHSAYCVLDTEGGAFPRGRFAPQRADSRNISKASRLAES
jgi:hypothetical protein